MADALEFTSIPCNLKMQLSTSRIVLLVFDNLVKELCDLERTALTMGEGVHEVILRITNASRVFSSYPCLFLHTYTIYLLLLYCIL